MVVLALIFSSFDNPETFSFKVVLLKGSSGKSSQIIEKTLKEISESEGENKILDLKIKDFDEGTLKEEVEKLKESKINAVVVIPPDFDARFDVWIENVMRSSQVTPPKIKVYYLKERLSSKTAAEIIKSIVKGVNNSLAKQANIPLRNFSLKEEFLGNKRTIKYKDYLYPAIIIFAFLSISLFGITQEVTELRSKQILKRLHLAPLTPFELFISFNASRVILMLIEFTIVSSLAILVLKVSINPFHPALLAYSALSAATFISLAFMLASLVENVQQATVVANIVLQVFQFLGGLYFDVFHLPPFLKWIVYANPVTYLVSGVRQSLGILKTPYPYYLSYVVPLIWIAASVLIASKYFRWVKER